MAKLDFPSSPVDGQVYAAPNGVNYTWISAIGGWGARAVSELTLASTGSISGNAEVGKLLAYSQGEAVGGTSPYTYSWQWCLSSDDSVLQVNGLTLTVPVSAYGDTIYIALTAYDAAGSSAFGSTSAYPPAGTITYNAFPNLSLGPRADGPNASPSTVSLPSEDLYGEVNGTWEDGFTSIYATGDIQFSVNGGAYGTGSQSISDGDTLSIIWDPAAIAAASDNARLEGVLTNGTFENNFSILIDRNPTGLNFANLTAQALSTQVTSDTITPAGYNVPVSVSFAGTATALTSLGLSVAGGAFGSSPQTVNPGQSLQLQGTTGGANSTTYGVDIAMGSGVPATDTWTATTTTATPTISQPSILVPANEATGINPAANTPAGITLFGSSYTPNNGAGAHTSSSWQLYKSGYPITSTNSITSVNSVQSNWTARSTGAPGSYRFSGLAYGDGVFVAAAYDPFGSGPPQAFQSDDGGVTWTKLTIPSIDNQALRVVYGNGAWVIWPVKGGGTGCTRVGSAVGGTWTSLSNGGAGDWHSPWYDMYYGGGQWNSSGFNNGDGPFNYLVISTSGSPAGPWGQTTSNRKNYSSLVGQYGNGVWIGWGGYEGGNNLAITTSFGGGPSIYSNITSVTASTLNQMWFGNGVFVAVGNNNGCYTSSDNGTTWTTRNPLFSGESIYTATYGNGIWMVGGTNNKLSISTDNAVSWSLKDPGFNTDGIYASAYSPEYNTFVIAGSSGKLSVSQLPLGSSTLTIAGAQTDGFAVGDPVISSPGGAASGTIASISDTQVEVTPYSNSWGTGLKVITNPSSYSQVVDVTGDTSNLESISVAQASLAVSSDYYARVQYSSASTTSDFSAWSKFTTASTFA